MYKVNSWGLVSDFMRGLKKKVENNYHVPGSSHWLDSSSLKMLQNVEKELKITERGR